jgi:signal transduction histidine kinase
MLIHDSNNALQVVGSRFELAEKACGDLMALPDEWLTAATVRPVIWRLLEHIGSGKKAANRAGSLGRKALPLATELMAPNATEVELNAVIEEVMADVRAWLEFKGIQGVTVRAQVAAMTLRAQVNAEDLNRALENLTRNAVDAMPSGGEVTISAIAQDEMVCVQVRDTGLGMDGATQAKCFEVGFTTKGARGTGLGLLQVKRFADEHGGRVRLESRPGAGTMFEICVPRAQETRLPGGIA